MTDSKFRAAFRGGQFLSGLQLTSTAPHWPRHLQGCIDFAFIDCEHHCFSREQVAWMCAAYRGAEITPLVRVLTADPALVRAAIDDGAAGIVVPYVETLDQVRDLVAAAKLRPIQGQMAAAAMRDQPLSDEFHETSRLHCGDVSLILQIESRLAVDRCDELLSVDEVDGVLVGPFDLTATLGCLGDHSDPRFQDAAKRVAEVARGRGMGAGIYFAESPEKEEWAKEWGYNLMIRGCDWSLIREAIRLRDRPV
ncbi:MAG: HpcH/HpaI aldolase/citrate lyase family protein [Rubripirellula sp.]